MAVCISLVPISDLILLLDHALDLTQVSSYLSAFFSSLSILQLI
jgi:hypothetical protein